MGMNNPQDELVEELIELRAKVAELTRVESAIPQAGDSMENDYRAELELKVRTYEASLSNLVDKIEELEEDLEYAKHELDAATDQWAYHEEEQYKAEQQYDDLKSSVIDALVDLSNVPLRDLVRSINDIISAVEGDVLA